MSGREAGAVPGPRREGHYVATSLSNNVQVGYDSFAIREAAGGLVVESRHVSFGGGVPPQAARFTLDADWTPRQLEITAEGVMTADIDFGEAECAITVRSPRGEQQMRFPVGRARAYFLMSGGLYFPLHIVRRFRFDDPAPQLFDLLPPGVCEVRRVEDVVEDGEALRQLEMRFQIDGLEDFARLVVSRQGDLVRYRTRNQNLLVKLEERG